LTAGAIALSLLAGAAVGGAAQERRDRKAERPPPACSHCKEKLRTIEALRENLPRDWTLAVERDAVFGGDMLTVRAGPAKAPTLLLVHGLGQNGFTDWLPVIPQLALRYRVLALDLPGFGYSASPPGKYSPRNYARVLSALLARHANGPAIVIGHSLGGAVALRLAADHPQQVSKLVLVNAAGILQRTAFVKHSVVPAAVESMPPIFKEPAARVRDWGNAVIERVFGLPRDPTRVLRASDLAWALLLKDRSNVNAALALIDEDFSAAVHTVQQPVHILWGDADTVAPLRTGQLLAKRLPRAQLATLPGVGHTPMETAPESFLALLAFALDTEPAPAAAADGTAAGANDLACSGQAERQYSGRYREVRIERCPGARLVNLSAERIVIRDSTVQMVNVQVRGGDVALDIANSELIATASDFAGSMAIRADASRLDLAGVHLAATGRAVEAARRSRLIASVSRIESPAYTGYWHEDRELENAALAP
jgi:pimeloyl-ACP methyl ester carboxylesterase